MSIGPSAQDVARLHDFLEALWHWEPTFNTVVLIDDALQTRNLERLVSVPPGVKVHSILHPRRGQGQGDRGGLAEGLLIGLDWIERHEKSDWILKIDTDALVIAPFAAKARALLAAYPRAGMFGLYDFHCTGEVRSFAPWDGGMFRLTLPFGFPLEAGHKMRRLRCHLFGRAGEERRLLLRARRAGYRWGEHCLGAAYILRMDTLRDMRERGYLRHPEFWRLSRISDDPIMGAYVKAAGWDLADAAREGGVFGIAYIGLPLTHEELEARNYSIIHSIKNDPRCPEDQIRRYFQNKRAGLSMSERTGTDRSLSDNVKIDRRSGPGIQPRSP